MDVIFDEAGNALSPHSITNAMWNYPDITQFQLIQRGKGEYTLKLNVGDDFDKEADIVESLQFILGEKAIINIAKVDEIPVLASGKRRYIVNEWIK